jgi:hypothetical protein
MSSLRLLLSGSLVAGGLILGAFTLNGAFDPRLSQTQAAGPSEPKGIDAFQTRTHFAGKTGEDAAPRVVKTGARPEAKPADTIAAEEKAARAAARRKLAAKRRAERAEKERAAKAREQPPPQQATLTWPWNWNWFGN